MLEAVFAFLKFQKPLGIVKKPPKDFFEKYHFRVEEQEEQEEKEPPLYLQKPYNQRFKESIKKYQGYDINRDYQISVPETDSFLTDPHLCALDPYNEKHDLVDTAQSDERIKKTLMNILKSFAANMTRGPHAESLANKAKFILDTVEVDLNMFATMHEKKLGKLFSRELIALVRRYLRDYLKYSYNEEHKKFMEKLSEEFEKIVADHSQRNTTNNWF